MSILNVLTRTLTSVEIELFNQIGQLVISKTQTQASQIETINVGNFAKGVYTIRLQNENGIIEVRKAMVNH